MIIKSKKKITSFFLNLKYLNYNKVWIKQIIPKNENLYLQVNIHIGLYFEFFFVPGLELEFWFFNEKLHWLSVMVYSKIMYKKFWLIIRQKLGRNLTYGGDKQSGGRFIKDNKRKIPDKVAHDMICRIRCSITESLISLNDQNDLISRFGKPVLLL